MSLLPDAPASPAAADLATIGEALASLTPTEPGRLRDVPLLRKDVGGAELNVAVTVARLGHRTRWAGRVGDDELGRQVLAVLRAERVDTSSVDLARGGRTGLYLKEQRPNGRLSVAYYRHGSAATTLRPDEVDLAALTDARIVHLTGITASLQPYGDELVDRVAGAARAAGRLVSFDANLRRNLLDGRDPRTLLAAVMKASDVLVFSDEEADELIGGHGEQALHTALHDLPQARCIVVHGAWGALAADAEGTWRAPSYPVEPVDTVGAGDAFVGGFLSGLLRRWPTERALALGNACGSCAVRVLGDSRSMPYEADALSIVDGPGTPER